MNRFLDVGAWAALSFALCSGCSSSDSTPSTTAPVSLGGLNPAPTAGDAQNPPTGKGADVEAWLASGAYKEWTCETLAHPQMKVSPHGKNRVCVNDKVANWQGAVGDERPVGSAGVKELYDDANQLVGYAVYAKTKATSDAGSSWYWYERVPLTSKAPNTAGIVADGLGNEGQAKDICVGCHAGAGSNGDHAVLHSSDFVYLQPSNLGAPNPAGAAGDAETPPTTNGTDVETWLAAGSYKSWKCEMMSHSQMKVSPHGKNRICSNAKVASFTGMPGDERPVGSAGVKELYDDNNTLVGYAVYVKVKPTSDGGASWYWYERVPTTSAAPNTAGIVADGLGGQGRAQSICVGCHSAAGSNADHSVMGSSDYVYAQISN